MGRYGNSIGLGIGQQHGFGHGNRRGCCDKLNSDNHDDEGWVCRWLGNSHGDVSGCSVDSSIWKHNSNGYWFHSADQ